MSQVYDTQLQQVIRETAAREVIVLKEGVCTQFTGPSFEAPAEIGMLKSLGRTHAD